MVPGFRVTHIRNQKWEPQIIISDDGDREPEGVDGPVRKAAKAAKAKPKILAALDELGPGFHTTRIIAEAAGITTNTAYKQLTRHTEAGKVVKQGSNWMAKSQ